MVLKLKTFFQGGALARKQKTFLGYLMRAPTLPSPPPPPIMTSISSDFRAYLKDIFALESLLKLAKFVAAEVIYQNVKKKVTKIIPAAVIATAEKGAKKLGLF
jgi:hypothetical protein